MKAVVSFYQAYPPSSGAASVAYNLALFLSGPRRLIQLGGQEETIPLADGLIIRTIAGDSGSRFKKLMRLPGFLNRVVRDIAAARADCVILEGSSWAVYLYALARRLKRLPLRPRIIYHAHNVEYYLRRQKNHRLIAELARWSERLLIRLADETFAVSEADAATFRTLYGAEVRILPNGVDVKAHPLPVSEAGDAADPECRDVLFMGLPAYPPNMAAIAFLVDKVFPLVLEREPRARLVIAGGDVAYHRPWLYAAGLVPFRDLPAFIRACRIGVVPVFSGSGTRLKILEFMAARLPVVATRKGAEGLAVEDGKNVVLREDAEGFASAIVTLLEDRALSWRLGNAGRELIEKSYDWERLVPAFEAKLAQGDGVPSCPETPRRLLRVDSSAADEPPDIGRE